MSASDSAVAPTSAPSYQVTIEPSGRSFSVAPGQTILAAALAAEIGLPYGCRDGACGSCKCEKTSGSVSQSNYSPNALSVEEEAAGQILTCRAHPQSDVVLQVRQVADLGSHPIKKLPVRVRALERLADDVMRMELQLPASDRFAYHAGQYIDFLLRDGSRRSYSMALAPHWQEEKPGIGLELHLRHLPGGLFTDHVFGGMQPKEILRIEGPFGSFYLREQSHKPMVFIVSGTGFAPAKAMIEHLHFMGSPRPVLLYWGGRRPQDLYLRDWVEQQAAHMPQLHFVPVLSAPQPEDGWTGRTGYVHQAVLDDFADLSGYQVYACGNPDMVAAARQGCIEQCNLPAEQFFADAFTSAADGADAAQG